MATWKEYIERAMNEISITESIWNFDLNVEYDTTSLINKKQGTMDDLVVKDIKKCKNVIDVKIIAPEGLGGDLIKDNLWSYEMNIEYKTKDTIGGKDIKKLRKMITKDLKGCKNITNVYIPKESGDLIQEAYEKITKH